MDKFFVGDVWLYTNLGVMTEWTVTSISRGGEACRFILTGGTYNGATTSFNGCWNSFQRVNTWRRLSALELLAREAE